VTATGELTVKSIIHEYLIIFPIILLNQDPIYAGEVNNYYAVWIQYPGNSGASEPVNSLQ